MIHQPSEADKLLSQAYLYLDDENYPDSIELFSQAFDLK